MNTNTVTECKRLVRRFESAIDGKVKQPVEGYRFVFMLDFDGIRIIEIATGKEMGCYPMQHISYIEWEQE